MKILVTSDSHGAYDRLCMAARREKPDVCFFLGDGLRDAGLLAEALPALPLYLVSGNCDFADFAPLRGLAPLGGLLFFYTHGHSLGVKNGIDTLWQAAHESGAEVALFGHTHSPFYEYWEGIHLFNPGALSQSRAGGPTYGVITLGSGEPVFTVQPFSL